MAKKGSSRKRSSENTPDFLPQAASNLQNAPAGQAHAFARGSHWSWPLLILIPVSFFLLCLTSISTIKPLAFVMLIASCAIVFIRFSAIRDRMNLLFVAVTVWVILSGISTLYAISGKFALKEFLKIAIAYGVFLIFIAFSGGGNFSGRLFAAILEGVSALAGLVSIDMISTRFLSTPFLQLLSLLSSDYNGLSGLVPGVRLTSIFTNPNIFAGFAGLGVILSLGLANSASKQSERFFHLVCLYISALSFVLAFSMGGSGTIAIAFLMLLLFEHKSRRVSLFILMVETLLFTLLATFPIFQTGFTEWDGVRPLPFVCTIAGAALLCITDRFVNSKLSSLLSRHEKAMTVSFLGILGAVVIYVILALNITDGIQIEPGDYLIRTAHLNPGKYTMETTNEADNIQLSIWSKNQEEVMMQTNTSLYKGPFSEAEFTVTDDSEIVFFYLAPISETSIWLDSVSYRDSSGESHNLKLHYKLLPGFIANRIQDVRANSNFVERLVFMEDGLKLFQRSPIIGLGMGAFESASDSVQRFPYQTKYVHNHYVQMLLETGVLGLAAFLVVLVLSLVAVIKNCRREDADPLTAALGASVVFMIGHAFVELVFSNSYYLPMALGIFALISLCCGKAIPLPVLADNKEARSWVSLVVGALLACYTVLLGCNMWAGKLYAEVSSSSDPAADLQTSIRLDRFEWPDPMLSYVYSARSVDDPAIRSQADQYAQRLAKVNSNTIPIYLAEYYFSTDRPELGLQMVEKYVSYTLANPDAWLNAFHVLEVYYQPTSVFRTGVQDIYQMLLDWNEENLGTIKLDAQAAAFVERVLE